MDMFLGTGFQSAGTQYLEIWHEHSLSDYPRGVGVKKIMNHGQ